MASEAYRVLGSGPVLDLNFSNADAERIAVLNEKANEGLLTVEENAELERFIDIAESLAYWPYKARKSESGGAS